MIAIADELTAPTIVPDTQSWRARCPDCTHGIVRPVPDLSGRMPAYQERLAQWRMGELRTCSCEAGVAYAAWLARKDQEESAYQQNLADLPSRLQAQRNERIFAGAGIPEKYTRYSLAGFERLVGADPGKRNAIVMMRFYLEHGHAHHSGERRAGILLWGNPGTGKTGSLSPVFTHLVRQGASGLWLQYNQMMRDMRRFEDGQVDERMNACQSAAYLFIDDLGDAAAQKTATDYARDVLFQIIDYRTSRDMPIFVTTNLSPQALAEQFDERTTRRLVGACAVINMGGKILR